MHLSLQDGLTALMKASAEGDVEHVKELLDSNAQVNEQDKVSGSITHCAHAMQHVPRVPQQCKGTLFSGCTLCYLITEAGTSLDEDTC